MQLDKSILKADWPAPNHVQALTTLAYWDVEGKKVPFNLSPYWGDKAQAKANATTLLDSLPLNALPWLKQVHGDDIVEVPYQDTEFPKADGSWTVKSHQACVILTADCLPIVITDTQGSIVCALHGGWRGLAKGIIPKAVDLLKSKTKLELMAWLGPAISAKVFQVGPEVKEAFVQINPIFEQAFRVDPSKPNHYLGDLVQIARLQFKLKGIEQVYGGEYCTYSEDKFFSYRQDPECGRMATLVWMNS